MSDVRGADAAAARTEMSGVERRAELALVAADVLLEVEFALDAR